MTNWLDELFLKAYAEEDTAMDWLIGDHPVFVYGTGTFASDLHRALSQKGIHVSAFLDHSDTRPEFCNGLSVVMPQTAQNSVVILGIHNRAADISRIVRNLKEIGVKKIISPIEVFDLVDSVLGDRYWLVNRDFYKSCKLFIENAYQLFKDDVSRELYRDILEFRLTGNYEILPEPDFEKQYFSSTVPAWSSPLRFVDCGAYNGDTLLSFLVAGMKIEAIVAFEPDNLNFSELTQLVSMRSLEIPSATLFPCGVYLSTTSLSFEMGQGEASVISGRGTQTVQCVALDDVIPTFAPNLIKMDIEGAEYDALLGSRRIISQYLPGLAISIYHRPEHLWQIPLLVEDMAPQSYDFYLRSHARSTFDTVLYCVSKVK